LRCRDRERICMILLIARDLADCVLNQRGKPVTNREEKNQYEENVRSFLLRNCYICAYFKYASRG
jgi:hypothetical protein